MMSQKYRLIAMHIKWNLIVMENNINRVESRQIDQVLVEKGFMCSPNLDLRSPSHFYRAVYHQKEF